MVIFFDYQCYSYGHAYILLGRDMIHTSMCFCDVIRKTVAFHRGETVCDKQGVYSRLNIFTIPANFDCFKDSPSNQLVGRTYTKTFTFTTVVMQLPS